MKSLIKLYLVKIRDMFIRDLLAESEKEKLLLGKILSNQVSRINLSEGGC